MLPSRAGCQPAALQRGGYLGLVGAEHRGARRGARLHRLPELGVRTLGFEFLLLSWWDFLHRSLRVLVSSSV